MLIISMFGGDCCNPMLCLRIDRTVTMKGKHVTVTTIPGATLNTVMRASNCKVVAVTDPPSPKSRDRFCADALVAIQKLITDRSNQRQITVYTPGVPKSFTSIKRTHSCPCCSPVSAISRTPMPISRSPT